MNLLINLLLTHRSPERIIDLSVILYTDKSAISNCSDDMELFRLIIDAMEDCATTHAVSTTMETEVALHASVECIVILLTSLQQMCNGDGGIVMSDLVTQTINTRYAHLKDADYSGPLTYQSMVRLPAPYRDVVAKLKQSGFMGNSDTESEGERHEVQSNGSGETEGPNEEDNQSSSDDVSKMEANWLYSHLEFPLTPG